MRTLVVSSSPLILKNSEYFAYSPYVKELEIWAGYSDEIEFTCPIWLEDKGLLNSKIDFPIHKVHLIKEFNFLNLKGVISAFKYSFLNFYRIYKSMKKADHIHLRCPGNVALMACFVQILLPKKKKTAKYAGNWDPNSKQPLSYRIQKWIVNNTFLTKNIQVLVYGEWENSSKNIKPFFTATYRESDKERVIEKTFQDHINFVFVGSLVAGKQPLYAIKLVEKIQKKHPKSQLFLYGNGALRNELEEYCLNNNLQNFIFFQGNQPNDVIKKAYQENHFVILPSKSEGWPKVIAEGMFWGCLPIASNVSCVSYMLNHEERGLLLNFNLQNDVEKIIDLIQNNIRYKESVAKAVNWSRNYTIDTFESEIKLLLKS